MSVEQRLQKLVVQKHAAFAARPDLVACALTGSVARDRVWDGSDLDFWAFWDQPDGEFEDGMIDGIYWEVDIQALDWLRNWDAEQSVQPPRFSADEFGVTPLEALWGARVLFDREGTLTRVVGQVARLMSDPAWLRRRAENYLCYGLECLAVLPVHDPARAILDARRIAIVYGINAYWMLRGQLLSSVIRIPERLHELPDVQHLLKAIFNLGGAAGWEQFYSAYQHLPPDIREEADPDMEREILPAVRLGMADGGLCHFRFIADGWLPLDTVRSVMGFESDLDAQQRRVVQETRDLLETIADMKVS
jgi:hypothetical protein